MVCKFFLDFINKKFWNKKFITCFKYHIEFLIMFQLTPVVKSYS